MDPQTTLYSLLAELAAPEPDRDCILEHLENLQEWIERGGFLPQVSDLAGRAIVVRPHRENVTELPPKPF